MIILEKSKFGMKPSLHHYKCDLLMKIYSLTIFFFRNNDIRDAILQIVNVIRTTEDKLERHEYRERVLGDQLKRGLISVDKKVKQWDHFKGTITRLDERLATVETILIQKEERERLQSLKTFDAVDDLQKNLPSILNRLKIDILEEIAKQKKLTPPTPPPLPPKPEITKKEFEALREDIVKKVDKMAESIEKMENKLKRIEVDTDTCKELKEKTDSNLKKLNKNMENEENLLQKYEKKLGEYKESIKEQPSQMKEQADWQSNFLKSLKEQKQRIEEVMSNVKNVSDKLNTLPQNEDLEKIENNTNNLVRDINRNTDTRTLEVITGMDAKLNDLKTKITKDHEEIKTSIVELGNMTEGLGADFGKNYEEMKSDLQSIKKVDEVMVQTADNVLDTKRRLEYGVHQILGEMGQLMKSATKDIANTISDRFDVFELSVLDDENGALANLTHKIGDEIDQVWRQIGIMHQKMNANADILTKLQNQTDAYVNGSANVMDNMKGKVAKITSKIVELDENLNYLMGRLMLVSREFNQIKTGLSKALDEIKGTFHAVQDKIKDPGPGPHNIEADEEPQVSPARKRSVN
ncbi:hypothetical protein HHI36_015366 [Cryptolaemus montrouzieri]|uniref:Uncharacterized protein n=1 Tax=Cryptolaemus montrouzieri TaxID=559131 RepID=A0ABD2N5E3_9CUCU